MLEIQTTFIFFPIVDVEISTCAEDALDLNVDDVDSRSLIRLYCVEILFVHRFLLVLVINKSRLPSPDRTGNSQNYQFPQSITRRTRNILSDFYKKSNKIFTHLRPQNRLQKGISQIAVYFFVTRIMLPNFAEQKQDTI